MDEVFDKVYFHRFLKTNVMDNLKKIILFAWALQSML